jgi:hypothetical protein
MFQKTDKKALENVCKSFGVSFKGNKKEIRNRLDLHLSNIKSLERIKSLAAIDCGTINLGLSRFSIEYTAEYDPIITIKDCQLIDPNLAEKLNIANYAHKLHQAMSNIYTKDTHYIIEQQSFRPLHVIPTQILKSRSVESILMGMLVDRCAQDGLYVNSVCPRMVSTFLNIAPQKSNYSQKKKNAINLVSHLIETSKINTSDAFNVFFESCKKKDDLCDSILMGFAFIKWYSNALKCIYGNNLDLQQSK